MNEQPATQPTSPAAPPVSRQEVQFSLWRKMWTLRRGLPWWASLAIGIACVTLVMSLWWFATRGEAEARLIRPSVLPSPAETIATFKSLWFDRALTRNIWASLKRVVYGFGLATLIGVPLGMFCGCFSFAQAFMSPITIFGRNIPIAALIPLTFSLFGIGELQKVMFIFIACVAFIISDSSRAIQDVHERYIDTAYTLGSGRWQTIIKVLVPLAMPDIFNSLRLLFGLAFGYIMLAELVKIGTESGGLGDIIIMSQRRGLKEHILLVLMIIPLVALAIDRLLYWMQVQLFPYRYGGGGWLHHGLRLVVHRWESLKALFFKPHPAAARLMPTAAAVPRQDKSA
ncbi:MAG: hypothetical protein HJJLKODD_00649 [Phycisphaerae bacterium]|nr:hypothetical protein [Phycisphaerae bacterium]